MIGTVIVRAIGDDRRQPVRLSPSAHQMIRGGFGGGVGRVRRIRGQFGEQTFRPERTVNFVGRDMMKTEGLLRDRIEAAPLPQRLLQYCEGTDHICLDKFRWTVDRAVNVTLGREVHYVLRLVLIEELPKCWSIAD